MTRWSCSAEGKHVRPRNKTNIMKCVAFEGGHLLASFQAELVGTLACYEGNQVVGPGPQGQLGRRLDPNQLGDRAGKLIMGAQFHFVGSFLDPSSRQSTTQAERPALPTHLPR